MASVLPFLLLVGIVARHHLLDQKPRAAAQARSHTQHIAAQLTERLDHIEGVMAAVSVSLGAPIREKPANDLVLRGLPTDLPGNFARWELFSTAGELIGSSVADSGSLRPDDIRSIWASKPAGRNALVSEPANLPASGNVVRLMLPISDARGDSALLIAHIRLQSIQEMLSPSDLSPLPVGSTVTVVSPGGVVLGHYPNPDRWVGKNISASRPAKSSNYHQSGTGEYVDADGIERLVSFVRMENPHWRIYTGIPMAAIFKQARWDFASALGYGGLALILALGLALWQSARIIDPVVRLSADAAKLGTGNLAHRSGVLGSDELGVLATTINEMATTLEQQGAVLRESEERYRGLFDINPLPMWVFDPESLSFLAVNRAAIEAYGYSESEFMGMRITDIRSGEELPALMHQLAKRAGTTRRYVARHRRKDGTVLHVEIDTGTMMFDSRPGRLVVAHDISERIRAESALRDAESQLRQSQRMEAIGQLTGGIAHDFNNVLTAIGSYSDFVYDSLDPGDARRLDILEIRKAADRAAALTKQLLAFSRSQILQPRVLNVNAAIAELELLLKRLLSADLTLVLACNPDTGHVRADPGQLTQVLINLAVNARDAMSPGGTLTIATRNARVEKSSGIAAGSVVVAPGDYVLIEVSDTGSGIAPDAIDRIFEPFFTTKELGKGTGLGLSTVYGIVHQSGGYVLVESTVGSGSTFAIYLPLVDQPVEPESARAEQAVAGQRSEVVLVVEDEEAVRRAAKRILEKKGYTVLVAEDGTEAMTVIGSHPKIDLLLTDLVMPGMGGRDLVRALKDQNRLIPTLYMSGYTKDAVMRAELDPDIMVLEKPFSHAELAAKVREVLDRAVTSD